MMDINILETIDMRELGKELQRARLKQGLTQEDAAKIVNVAPTIMAAIETGEQRITPEELMKFAQTYGHQIDNFVHRCPKAKQIQVEFSKLLKYTDQDIIALTDAVTDLEELCLNYIELEQITDSPLIHKYPLEYEITAIPIEQFAESIALQERHRLGLGDGPIASLRDMLEQDVGLRIFYLALHPIRFSAMYFYADQLGGCMVINALYSEDRRRWSLARNYAHFLVHRYQPAVLTEKGYQQLSGSEHVAEAFARCFLVPTSGLMRRFNEIGQTKAQITAVDLCTLAHYYRVPVAVIILRLEEMQLLPEGIWDKLRANGSTVIGAQQSLELLAADAKSIQNEQLPIRYQYLAVNAFDRALIGEGRFASLLGVDRVEARSIAELLRQSMQDVVDDIIIDIDLTELSGA